MPDNRSITEIEFTDFTLFSDITIPFARDINIISGETSVGKTNIMKALYSYGKTINEVNDLLDPISVERISEMITSKFLGVFRPDERKIGRLVKRNRGRGTAICKITFDKDHDIKLSFSNLAVKNIKLEGYQPIENWPRFVYIPAKEIISSTENFSALYENYHIAFEETYYDLSKLLLLPTRKGPLNSNQKKLIKTLEKIIDGKVTLESQKFYLKTKGLGNIEMGLLAEGYRKISTLLQLISNETLDENTILFWDEPESNINPKMIPALKEMLVALAQMGVQIFITTHSYFLQQELSLFAQYNNENNLDIRFITLYPEEGNINFESQKLISDLLHNPIQQEFMDLYNREQELFYDHT
ncbi:AAA family ATPase [Paenibacillus sp. 22594]|uniref:AAA family ATPase n=1 Tax=Paenibacillus sp. 22594 TaxID=3453947 RepID=UPI003F87D600